MIPLETAEAIAGINSKDFYYDQEKGVLNYICPEYEFGNTSSDYRMGLILVDLKGEELGALQSEIEKMAGRYGAFTENDKMTVKSIVEVSEGNGTIVFAVNGDNARDITVQVRNGYALKVSDPYNVPQRMDNRETAPNGAGMGNGYQHGKNK